MPNITLSAAHFPDGTSVGAYPVSNWGGETKPSGAPQGSATATVVASNGVAFTGLAAGAYWAVGQVAGVYKYVRFVAGEDFAVDPLMKAANLSDLASAVTARANLGLGASGTLAARPAAGSAGRIYYATDTKIDYLDNGTVWVPLNIGVLGQSAVAVSNTAVTTEETLATIAVPANALGPNGRLRITTLWTMTNSANAKTPRVRFSGAAGTQYANFALTTSAGYHDQIVIANRNATNSQVGPSSVINGHFGNGSGAPTTSAVDTTAATSVVISGQKALAGEVLTLESYLVELMPG